jgi:hypothetical protein
MVENMSMRRVLVVGPVILTVGWLLACAGSAVVSSIRAPFPLFPWESAMLLEGVRHLRGDNAFTTDAASTMYGALYPVYLSALYAIGGPGQFIGRLSSLLCSFAAFGMLLALTGNIRRPLAWLLTAGMYGAAFFASGRFFGFATPDMPALLLASLAALALYCGYEGRRPVPFVAGVILALAACFVKQTYLAVIAVPVVASLLNGTWKEPHVVRYSICAFVAVLAVFAMVWLALPRAWHHMFEVAAQYPLDGTRMLLKGVELVVFMPLFLLVAAYRWLAVPQEPAERRGAWFDAAVAVGFGTSLLAYGKAGGTVNSLIPALYVAAAFCLVHLPQWSAAFNATDPQAGRSLLAGLLMAVAIALPTYPKVTLVDGLRWNATANPVDIRARYLGDPRRHDYREVVSAVAALPGTSVISPTDPSIALGGKGIPSPSVYQEGDASGWDGTYVYEGLMRRYNALLGEIAERACADFVALNVPSDFFLFKQIDPASVIALGYDIRFRNDSYVILERRQASARCRRAPP